MFFIFNSKHIITVVIYSIKHFCACYEDQLAIPTHRFAQTLHSYVSHGNIALNKIVQGGGTW